MVQDCGQWFAIWQRRTLGGGWPQRAGKERKAETGNVCLPACLLACLPACLLPDGSEADICSLQVQSGSDSLLVLERRSNRRHCQFFDKVEPLPVVWGNLLAQGHMVAISIKRASGCHTNASVLHTQNHKRKFSGVRAVIVTALVK